MTRLPGIPRTSTTTAQFDEEARLRPITPTGEWVVKYEEPLGEARKSAESATKPRLDLLPTAAVEQIAEVLTFGAAKYDDNNWCRGTRWGRYYAALLRHVFAWWRGENSDPETGMSHLAHAGCCLLFLMEYQRNGRGTDDRSTGPDNKPFTKHDTGTDIHYLPDHAG